MKTAALISLLPAVLAIPAPQNAPGGGAPQPAPPAAPGAPKSNACEVVATAFTQQQASNPNVNARVPASQAFACLQSVPNKQEPASKLVASLNASVQWQSTLAYLKDPPASYNLPATDINGGLAQIAANVTAGVYKSEYDFQLSMVLLLASAHDGHFGYRSDVFKAFSFRNDLAADIVSVSTDGKEPPKLYNFSVLNGTTTMLGNQTIELGANGFPPAIAKINGQNATQFMIDQGLKFINSQDLDSQWNAQFMNYAAPTGRPLVSASIFHQGDSLTLEYENGQTITQDSYALIRSAANFTGIKTGEDFYSRFCTPSTSTAGSTGSGQAPAPPGPKSSPPPPPPNLSGFPLPAIRDSGANVTAGYFLTGPGYDDVAVLSVLGFAPEAAFDPTEYIVNFQKMVGNFLAMSKDAGKKKLVVDVTGNGGGLVIAGFELYSQIFPKTPLFQANNLRRSDSLQMISKIGNDNLDKILQLDASALGPNATLEQRSLVALAQSNVIGNLLPGGVFSAGGKVNYTLTSEIIAPVSLHGDTFTAYQSTPLNQTSPDFNLTGTGNRADVPAAVFSPENVVILTDGTCGSTCTLFSYLMIMQQNVKTVVVGGRPQTGPMQSIAGVEGAQVFELEDLQQLAAAAFNLAPADQKAALKTSEMGIIAEGYVLARAAAPGAAGAVNGKNAFSHTDAQTPLQFLTQNANCRFFYTRDMILGPEATWRRAVDAIFNAPGDFCVEGSQTPLMGVQEPSQDFFTPAALGGAPLTAPAAPAAAPAAAGPVAAQAQFAMSGDATQLATVGRRLTVLAGFMAGMALL